MTYNLPLSTIIKPQPDGTWVATSLEFGLEESGASVEEAYDELCKLISAIATTFVETDDLECIFYNQSDSSIFRDFAQGVQAEGLKPFSFKLGELELPNMEVRIWHPYNG